MQALDKNKVQSSEQPSPRNLGFFRARARALFRSSWSDRARAVTRAQLLKNFHAYNDFFYHSDQLIQKLDSSKPTAAFLPLLFERADQC